VDGAVADDRLEALRSVEVFSGFSDELLARLADRVTPHHVLAGDWLIRQGEKADRLYVVVSGRLDVILENPGPERTLGSLAAGSAVGELGVLTGAPRAASVRAVRDSELLALDAKTIATMFEDTPAFAGAMVKALALHLQNTVAATLARPPIAVLTVVAEVDAPWVERVTAALLSAQRKLSGVVALSAPPDGDPGAYGRLLDHSERDHDLVVLLAGSSTADDDWTRFCLRQADRVLVIARAHTAPPSFDPGTDLHVAICGPGRSADHLAPWLDGEPPATHHHVDLGSYFDGDINRLARRLTGRSVGVVLSGGGARGMAHIGALQVLLEAGFEIDRAGGCSMGSLMATMFAAGIAPEEMMAACRREFVERNPFNDYTVPRASLLRAARGQRMLERMLGRIQLEEMVRPCFTVACDLVEAECIVHRRGPAWEAVGISMCIPGLTPPVVRDDRILVDGGVLNNMPVDVMLAEPGPVIAVDVMAKGWSPRTIAWEPRPSPPGATALFHHLVGRGTEQVPRLSETLTRTSVIGNWRLAQENRARADVVISPEVGHVGLLDFSRLDELVEAGRAAARERLADLEAVVRI
jgi:NTE family protein